MQSGLRRLKKEAIIDLRVKASGQHGTLSSSSSFRKWKLDTHNYLKLHRTS